MVPLDNPSVVLLYYDGETHRREEPSGEWQLLNPTLDPSPSSWWCTGNVIPGEWPTLVAGEKKVRCR